MTYQQLCRDFKFNEERLTRIKPIFDAYSAAALEDCYKQMVPGTFFVGEGGGFPQGSTYWFTVVRTEKKLYLFHSEAMVVIAIENGGESYHSHFTKNPSEEIWKQLFLDIGPGNFELSHYDYLELIIDEFWRGVFGKTTGEMWCGGIITAHGDKAYGYKDQWKKAGIPFGRGVLLFLLTYTKELGDTPKHESCEWVIANYQKYLPHVEAAEKLAGLA